MLKCNLKFLIWYRLMDHYILLIYFNFFSDENECLDRMLGALSDELQAKSQSTETWDSAAIMPTTNEFDLETTGDLDPEEVGTLAASGAMASALRLATAPVNALCVQRDAVPPFVQRLLSNLSTPWQSTMEENHDEEAIDNHAEEISVTSMTETQVKFLCVLFKKSLFTLLLL